MTINLTLPLTGPITQRFGERPEVYSRWGYAGHNGTDFGIPVGTQVKASAPGSVQTVGWDPDGYGNYVMLKHLDGQQVYYTYYCHLSRKSVQVGQQVERGEVVGLSGNTGFSTGPHLHWELRIVGKVNPGFKNCFDPMLYVGDPEHPVPPEPIEPGDPYIASAVVTADVLNVRSGPGTGYPVIGQLHEGDQIEVTGVEGREIWVRHATGWSAWKYAGQTYLEIDDDDD